MRGANSQQGRIAGFLPVRCFTLVEMLVIVAILCILLAFLMPALNTALDSARQTSCANNLKQIGAELFSYSDDFYGFVPAYSYNYNGTAQWEGNRWFYAMWNAGYLAQYRVSQAYETTKGYKKYKCDADWPPTATTGDDSCSFNYGMNIYSFNRKRKLSTIPQPSERMWLSEPYNGANGFTITPHTELEAVYGFEPRHDAGGRVNCLYADGRVRGCWLLEIPKWPGNATTLTAAPFWGNCLK